MGFIAQTTNRGLGNPIFLNLSRLSAAEQDLHTSQGGVEELRSEFTKRIGTTEKKLQTIVKVITFDDVVEYTCRVM